MRFDSVDQWLQWQMDLHTRAIDLGLERVREVGSRLGLERIAPRVITVAGTNGKGSTVAAYEFWLQRNGYRVASYTSPHLLRYNERIKLNTTPVEDRELCAAFAAVEDARGDTSLTYFEFGTLAALHLMQKWRPDFALLEVGLGGRLDAVNIIDAGLAHLTPIGLDHEAWLGDTREKIGFEKAGILRPGIDVIINDREPPQSVLQEVERLGCNDLRIGRDYDIEALDQRTFNWRSAARELRVVSPLAGAHQQDNLAGVIAGLSRLIDLEGLDDQRLGAGFDGLTLAGRFQRVPAALNCRLFVDVGHNADAAASLAANIEALRPRGRVVVVLGMLADKRPDRFVEILDPAVDEWWLLSLDGERGQSAVELAGRVNQRLRPHRLCDDISTVLDHALSSLGDQDIMLVTGSFVSVEQLLRALPDSS